MTTFDIIDHLADIRLGSRLDDIRRARPQTRDNIQASYQALFKSHDVSVVSQTERLAMAVFVTGLHQSSREHAFYVDALQNVDGDVSDLQTAIAAAVAGNQADGPHGAYPPGPLSAENTPAPVFQEAHAVTLALGTKLAAAFAHAHMLVFHPRDADRAALDQLLAAGWSTTGIVTLSQLIAFLSLQIRVAQGLRQLATSLTAKTAA